MTTKSPQPKGRDRALSTLNTLIQALNLAKTSCGIPQAQVVFGSASVLLTTMKVCSYSFRDSELPTQDHSGHSNTQTELRRTRDLLRRCMPNT